MSCNCIPSDNITRFQWIICCMSSSWHLMICFLTGEESKITRFMRGNGLSFGHVHPSQEEPRCCEFTIYPTICNVIRYNSPAFITSILQIFRSACWTTLRQGIHGAEKLWFWLLLEVPTQLRYYHRISPLRNMPLYRHQQWCADWSIYGSIRVRVPYFQLYDIS